MFEFKIQYYFGTNYESATRHAVVYAKSIEEAKEKVKLVDDSFYSIKSLSFVEMGAEQ